ncbi:arylsulfotransferase family protein [Maritimibacter dapengensis]|uniref:Arylsulfotransferase family protein n=1 Tax=Maritimibacter dapengensis TaxID=2836868 RepID=A0ABS6SYQ1_9RHOB|nr:arylsulfotransferase family protein [Maritimibacter dapengensis]MBV7378100.1 arylsulfotransferase family protein [Maritimibacter dapengensis]
MALEESGRTVGKKGVKAPSADKILLGVAIFMLGGLMSMFGAAPFPALHKGFVDTVQLVQELRQTRSALLAPSPYEGEGVVTHDPARAQRGLTLIQGIMPGGAQVKMIDMDGAEIHRWEIDYFDVYDAPTHVVPAGNLPKSKYHFHTQGFWPLPDGSLVANIGGVGTVRLDQCSNPVWATEKMAHHSITRTADGTFWVPGDISIYDTPDALLPAGVSRDEIAGMLVGTLKNYNNSLLLLNADGEVEREFSVLQSLMDAGLERELYASQQEILADPTHINDIEVVNAALADKIEGVAEGDLLVSIREMHMLAIFDQFDGHLKWHRQGTWVRQHDPDIMPDGTIEIFNNRARSVGDWVTNSQILSYDPATDETVVLHPQGEEDKFYSSIMGTHQRLENGNVLITETMAGRMFEATPDGAVVWDYRLPYDDEVASAFEAGARVPTDYFDITNWTCKETKS